LKLKLKIELNDLVLASKNCIKNKLYIYQRGVGVLTILNKSRFSHMSCIISVCYIDFSIKANKNKS